MLFSELGLSTEMLKAIDKLGFEQASPIQAEAIPLLLTGRDIVGQSQTGSGKTAAFAIPAIEKTDPLRRQVQVLILCPTRELAVQVSEEIHKLAFFKRGLHVLPVYGGQSYERQFYGLKQGAQIVIGTPGRVMDHMRRGTLQLGAVQTVILDEADVMLDMGFREDIEFILQGVPAERQTVFFSATMPRAIRELIERYAREPQNVKIEQKAMTVPTVEQVFYEVDRRFKIELLTRLIDIHDLKLGIIFCNTKRMVDDLVDHLEAQGYSADRLHGDMTQAMRDRVMNKFRKSGLEFLVATDVAARGIDVDDVQVVFNYDLPYDGQDYVHRIGRTGRAGRSGRAISFVSGREVFQIRNIERFTNVRIQRAKIPTVDEVEEARVGVFLDKIRSTLKSGEYKRQDHLIERLLEEGFSSTDIASALLHHLQGGEAQPPQRPVREPSTTTAPTFPAERSEPRAQPELEPRSHEARMPSGTDLVPARRSPKSSAPRPAPFRSGPAVGGTGQPSVSRTQGAEPTRRIPSPPPEGAAIGAGPAKARERAEHDTESAPSRVLTAGKPTGKPGGKPTDRVLPKYEKRIGAKAAERRETIAKPAAAPEPSAKHSRRTPGDQTRLWVSIGSEMGVGPGDVVGAIMGETGLPAKTVGTIDLRERHLFVDVASEHANAIISKLNRTTIRGRKIKVKVA